MIGAIATVLVLGGLLGFTAGFWLRGQKNEEDDY